MKVVLNRGSGSFSLSQLALQDLIRLGWDVVDDTYFDKTKDMNSDIISYMDGNKQMYGLNYFKYNVSNASFRSNEKVIAMFEELRNKGLEYNGEIEIVEIPDNIAWYIECDDESGGYEVIHEEHRTW